ncbi:MAG: hypothetical protein ACK2U2_13600 [Anaerolineae bacterium]|jgi:hypothetical protein
MSSSSAFAEIARAYADGVRVLFAPTGAVAGERGGRGPVSYEDLAVQAEDLAPVSEQFTREAETRLEDGDPMARIQASTSLLAKAITDLQISVYLLEAAMEQEEEYEFAAVETEQQRGLSGLGPDEELLGLITGELQTMTPAVDRGRSTPGSVPDARVQLSNSVDDAVDLISSRAGKVGQSALGGLIGIGAAELISAAGIVGMDIAEALGQAETVTRLYELVRSYISGAIESLIALVGRPALEAATDQALDWINEMKEGRLFGELLLKAYGTDQIIEELHLRIAGSQAGLEQFVAAAQDVDKLDSAFHQQIKLAEKLLKGLRFVGGISAAALPASKLVMAAAYLVLGIYIVLAGGDYVDAPHLQFLNRVPGVRQVVEVRLAVV